MLEEVSRELVWYDSEQLSDVNYFPSKMQQGVEQAQCIIIFLSRVYLSRQNCSLELMWAWQQHKLKGKELVISPVDSTLTLGALAKWTKDGHNLQVDDPCAGRSFCIHQSTLEFVSQKLEGFKFRTEWQDDSATDEQRWKAVMDIAKQRPESLEHANRKIAKIDCRAENDIWLLEDLGEEELPVVSLQPPNDELAALFQKNGLGTWCRRVCSEIGASTLDNLRLVQDSDMLELKISLRLKPVIIETLKVIVRSNRMSAGVGSTTKTDTNMVDAVEESAIYRDKRALSPDAVLNADARSKNVKLGEDGGDAAATEEVVHILSPFHVQEMADDLSIARAKTTLSSSAGVLDDASSKRATATPIHVATSTGKDTRPQALVGVVRSISTGAIVNDNAGSQKGGEGGNGCCNGGGSTHLPPFSRRPGLR